MTVYVYIQKCPILYIEIKMSMQVFLRVITKVYAYIKMCHRLFCESLQMFSA